MLKVREQSCDPVAPATVDEAQRRLLALLPSPTEATLPLANCIGRVAARAIISGVRQPRFDAAAMDGWAVTGDTAGLYRIVGESCAGQGADRALEAGEAVRISTGAPVAAGATRIVRQEHATLRGTLVEVPALVDGRRDIRGRGSDIDVGSELIDRGKRLDHLDIARLSAAGISEVAVADRPRIAIIPTGNEIVPIGGALSSDQINDALSVPIAARCAEAGGAPRISAAVRDAEADVLAEAARADVDILVFIGGASKGPHDVVRPALRQIGLDLAFTSVLMRPGKPVWAGRLGDGRLVVGLPGNPVAALVCAELFLLPLIRAWQGGEPIGQPLSLRCATALTPAGGLERFQFGRLGISPEGTIAAELLGGDDSAALAPITGADLLLRHPSVEHGGRDGRAEALRLRG